MENLPDSLIPPECRQRYRPTRMLGSGGFARVYLATQASLERQVVVKVLLADSLKERDHCERFLAEARLTASLSHPNIVRVIDHGVDEATPWIVYEYLPGGSLRDLIAAGAFSVADAVSAACQVAAALERAHGHGVIHRDIKPENVLSGQDGAFKVTDFGIAKWATTDAMTRTGIVLGSPAYMAPEAISATACAASDQYSLGVMLYEMVTGQQPFYHENLGRLLAMQLGDAPPLPRALNPGILPSLERLILQALAKDPADRFPTISAMGQQLETLRAEVTHIRSAVRRSKRITACRLTALTMKQQPPRQKWPAVAAGVVLLALLGWFGMDKPTVSPRLPLPQGSLDPRKPSPAPRSVDIARLKSQWNRYHSEDMQRSRLDAITVGNRPPPKNLRSIRANHETFLQEMDDFLRANPTLAGPPAGMPDKDLDAALEAHYLRFRLILDVRALSARSGSGSPEAFWVLISNWVNEPRTVRDGERLLALATECLLRLSAEPVDGHPELLIVVPLLFQVYSLYAIAQQSLHYAPSKMGRVLADFLKSVSRISGRFRKHLVGICEELNLSACGDGWPDEHIRRLKVHVDGYYKFWPVNQPSRSVLEPLMDALRREAEKEPPFR